MALHHGKAWREIVVLKKLKGWETIDLPTIRKKNWEPFSLEGFYQQLVCWVSVDDQVGEKLCQPLTIILSWFAVYQCC